ncbi:ovostatin homolog [Xenopus laevis]|uniref:Ovostatin homolog n=1 Tax=Xenopus laevis TaxID=8355 RepID=A0A8J1LC53_XENLA|nr:ovostatin homolog [Xenopus laevis]
MQTFYKPGIPYFVAMMLQDCDGNPMKNALIELLVEEDNIQNVTTDANGKAQCVIDMSRYDSDDLFIKAFYIQDEYDGSSQNTSDISSYLYLPRFRSRTGDYIQAYAPQLELDCGKTYDVKVHYLFSREGLLEGARNISFYYLMVSQDKIVKSGERLVDVSSTLQGQFSLSVTIPSQYSSSIDIMVYCMLQSEVLSSHVHLIMEKCFKNQVSLIFSASEGASGSDVNLMLKADPKSLCGLQIIDSSILLHLNNWPLTPEKLEHVLYHPDKLVARWNQFTWDPDRLCGVNASFYDSPLPYDDEGFANLEFQHAGLIFATNASLQNPQMCEKIRGAARHVSMQKNMYLHEKYYKYYRNTFHGGLDKQWTNYPSP